MTRWEYMWEQTPHLSTLNELGSQGWEIIARHDEKYQPAPLYLLKRPIPQPILEHLMQLPARAHPPVTFKAV